MNLILSLMLLAGIAPSNTPQPVLMFDSGNNAFPSGSGTPLGWSPQPVACYTNASGAVIPCVFPATSTATDVAMNFGLITITTASSNTSVPLTPVAAITVTRVEWNLPSLGSGCTTTPILTVLVNGSASAYTVPITTIGSAFSGHVDGTLNVAANAGIVIRTTTASVGCATPATAAVTLHYKMQ